MSLTCVVKLAPNRLCSYEAIRSSEVTLNEDHIRGIVCLAAALFGEGTPQVLSISHNGNLVHLGMLLQQAGAVLAVNANGMDCSVGCKQPWLNQIKNINMNCNCSTYTIRAGNKAVGVDASYLLTFEKWDFFRGMVMMSRWLNRSLTELCDGLHMGNRQMDIASCLEGQAKFLDEGTQKSEDQSDDDDSSSSSSDPIFSSSSSEESDGFSSSQDSSSASEDSSDSDSF